MRSLLGLLLLSTCLVGAVPSEVQGIPSCQFVLGFEVLRDLIPQRVGSCLEDERHGLATGDGVQRTSGGLLVWRKADNRTAFTDGYRTWLVGPTGLQERLNTERFPWETGAGQGAGMPMARQLTVADDGSTVQVAAGDTIFLQLVAPSGGADWQIATPDPRVLALTPQITAPPIRGTTIATFRAVGLGQADLTATSRAACAADRACLTLVRLFQVTIIVAVE